MATEIEHNLPEDDPRHAHSRIWPSVKRVPAVANLGNS